MDIDDDDAFLYGEESPPKVEVPLPATTVPAPAAAIPGGPDVKPDTANSGLSSSMAASLAAYGIEPSAAVVENPEDGGVEEEEEEDDEDSDDSDEDDIKVVFSGQNSRMLDLRKPQTQPSNVIGIGKWAQSSTGQAQVATPSTPQQLSTPSKPIQPTANQTTEYTPTSRPGVAQLPAAGGNVNAPSNPPIPSAPTDAQPTLQLQPQNAHLPPSSLPPALASSTHPKVDPTNPSGVIPSTGQSVFDIDMTQFEGSGQPWRKPGSAISDWFNFGFDENSYPRYLRYRAEMEQGRAAMMNVPPMASLPNEISTLLHLQNNMPMGMINGGGGSNFNNNPMAQQQMQQQMQAMANQMGLNMNPQMMQQMMAMGMNGMDMPMNNFGMQGQGQGQGQMGMQGQQPQHQGNLGMQRQGNVRPNATPQAANVGTPEAGEETVKQEEGEAGGETPEPQQQGVGVPALRGRGMPLRGMPTRGVAQLRGRGGAVPIGPRAGFAAPTGPKAGRFRDKDRVDTSGAGSLDYGASEGGGDSDSNTAPSRPSRSERDRESTRDRNGNRSRSSASPKRTSRRSSRRKSYDDDYSSGHDSVAEHGEKNGSGGSRSQSRSRTTRSRRDRERDEGRSRRTRTSDRDRERERDEGGTAATLGPEGWESDEEDERRGSSSRRKRSPSTDEEQHTRRSKRR